MFKEMIHALRMLLIMTLLLGIVYPLGMTAVAETLFPYESNGSLIEKDGQIIGSRLIGQSFTKPGYFHSRPSAAGDDGYDAAGSGGSNLGPTSEKLIKTAADRIQRVRTENFLSDKAKIPADAVLASASGLDPHISPEYAYLQVQRVSKERGLLPETVVKLVDSKVRERALGIFGEPMVNVLELNMALDELNF